jgi:hypothetical protein
MKSFIALWAAMLVFCAAPLNAQEVAADRAVPAGAVEEGPAVLLPVNVYDGFSFEEPGARYIRIGAMLFGPAFVMVWGVTEWGWFSGHGFMYEPSDVYGADSLNGLSDKFGHMHATYIVKRMANFIFSATGSSRTRANVESAIYAESIQLMLEIGDGFSSAHGFDIYDVVFNTMGVGFAMVLDQFPVLDRMFALQWEYIPTKRLRRNIAQGNTDLDFFTDYSGQKYLFTTKLGGIPHLSLTPLRYVNVDLGYYAKGYYNDYYKYSTKNVYVGISVNYSIAFGDVLPTGYASSTLQSVFNYIHPPWDIEAKTWELSKIEND